jgi:uncharacterized protein YjbI with pentapeptide repeats
MAADLRGADFSALPLAPGAARASWPTRLADCQATGANFSGAKLTDSNMRRAILRGADLTDVDARGADMARADLVKATTTNFKR